MPVVRSFLADWQEPAFNARWGGPPCELDRGSASPSRARVLPLDLPTTCLRSNGSSPSRLAIARGVQPVRRLSRAEPGRPGRDRHPWELSSVAVVARDPSASCVQRVHPVDPDRERAAFGGRVRSHLRG